MSTESASFFCFDQPPVSEELLERLQSKLEISKEIEAKIDDVKSLLKKELNFHLPEDAFLLQLLRIRKYDVERTALLCKKFYSKLQGSRFFENIDFSIIQRAADQKTLGILPSRDPDGCVVFVVFAGRWDPLKLSVKEYFQVFLFSVLQCMRCSAFQVAGFRVICDFSGYSATHISHVSPGALWHGLDSLQNCFPFPFKGCYVVNENAVFGYLWSIIKLLLKKKLRDRCHILGKDMKTLKELFPEAILFEEFSGSAGPFSSEPWIHIMIDFPEYLTFVKQYGYHKL